MVRAFIALEISREMKDRLQEAQEMLRGSAARLTFVEPENIHITVKFLGDVDEKRLAGVKEVLKTVGYMPFPITAGVVTVNDLRRPHTIWSVIGDGGHGAKIVSRIDDGLVPYGFAREIRQYMPHATIARVKSPDPSLLPTLRLLEGRTYGSCMVSGLKLKKSTLSSRGPVYEDLLEVPW